VNFKNEEKLNISDFNGMFDWDVDFLCE